MTGTALQTQQATSVNTGRPCLYRAAVARSILDRLAAGESLRSICRDEGMPPASTVREWLLDDRDGFAALYERARLIGCYALADEILEIASDDAADLKTDKDGRLVVNHANVQRARLKVETKKWLLSKLLPAQFGDKVEARITGPGGGPLQVQSMSIDVSKLSPDELRVLEAMLERAALPSQ